MPNTNIKTDVAHVDADKVVLSPGIAEGVTSGNQAIAEKVADALVDSQGKVASTLVNSQAVIAADLNEREKRAEAREERREIRDWWFKVIFGILTFISTMAGIWSAMESSDTKVISKRTEHTVNSRMDDMIKRVEEAAFAKGKLKGEDTSDKDENNKGKENGQQ